MKMLINLNGVKTLSKNEQKVITGGKYYCDVNTPCPSGQCCKGTHTGVYCETPSGPSGNCFFQE